MYVQDYDETAPRYYQNPQDQTNIMTRLLPYINNVQVWVCPSGTGTGCVDPVHNPETSQRETFGATSYGYNIVYESSYGDWNNDGDTSDYLGWRNSRKLATCRYPATTVLFADFSCERLRGYNNVWSRMIQGSWARHNDGNNYSFADGHVKWFKVIPYGSWFEVARSTENTNYGR